MCVSGSVGRQEVGDGVYEVQDELVVQNQIMSELTCLNNDAGTEHRAALPALYEHNKYNIPCSSVFWWDKVEVGILLFMESHSV